MAQYLRHTCSIYSVAWPLLIERECQQLMEESEENAG